jgi:hypothetical protein
MKGIFNKFDSDYISKICQGNFKVHYNLTSITGTLREDIGTFMIISPWGFLGTRNIPEERCRENQNAFLCAIAFLSENRALTRHSARIWYSRTRYMWQYNKAHGFGFWITKTTDTHTHRICNTYCFSAAKMVTRMRLSITLYVHCLSCLLSEDF